MTDVHSRIARNTIVLYIRMAVNLLIGLYTSRLALNILGDVPYGVYGTIMAVVIYIFFIPASIGLTSDRFLAYGIGRENRHELKRIFSNILSVYILTGLAATATAFTIGTRFVSEKIVMPANMAENSFVFLLSGFLFFAFQIVAMPFTSLITANERMDVIAFINIGENIMKLILLLILSRTTCIADIFSMDTQSEMLAAYMCLLAICTFTSMIASAVFSVRNFDECTLRPRIDKNIILPIIKFYMTDFYNIAAANTMNKGMDILKNRFFGPVANTASTISWQINVCINSLASNMLATLRPPLIKSYASNQKEEMNFLILFGSELASLLMILLLVPVYFEAGFLIKLWLGRVPLYVTVFLRIMILSTLADNIYAPLWQAIIATGNIKRQSILDGTLAFLALAMTWLGYKYYGLPVEICYVLILIKSCICGCNILIMAKKNLPGFSAGIFVYKCIFKPLVYATAVSFPAVIIHALPIFRQEQADWLKFIATFVCTTAVWLLIITRYSFNEKIRKNLLMKTKNKAAEIYRKILTSSKWT